MTNSNYILSHISNSIATLTLNRPEVHNAFDDVMIQMLNDELQKIEQDKTVRVVLLEANGKSFCAGADLNWMQRMVNYTEQENLIDSLALAKLMQQLNHLSKPTIAIVGGNAFGGGVGLIACCDIVVAKPHVQFCLSEVKLGLIPAVISPYVIAMIGERAARRFFITAERFDAKLAQELGLVHIVAEELNEPKTNLINHLLRNGPQAIKNCKKLIQEIAFQNINDSLTLDTARRIAKIRISDEGQEGVKAFLEKRKPNWIKTDDL